jgi:thiol:disulfide interchange protein DsbD
VVNDLSDFMTLRVDATRAVSPEAEDLLGRYEVYGVPTILVFDAHGREHQDLRVTGFIRPKELRERLARLRR